MRRWERQWRITLVWDRADWSPVGVRRQELLVDARQLAALVRRARADPHVVGFPFRPEWVLAGDEPEACRAGHEYAGGSATRPVRTWRDCTGCRGHMVYSCRLCPDVLVEPVPGPDCRPRAV